MTLSDEDRTVVTGAGGWRALNTLAHYGVRDSAVMALIPRQNDSFSSNCKCLGMFGEGSCREPKIRRLFVVVVRVVDWMLRDVERGHILLTVGYIWWLIVHPNGN